MNFQESRKTIKWDANGTILQIMVSSIALLIADYLMDSVRFDKSWIAILTAVVLALLNAFVKPLLIMLTLPATIFTLGLFLLVINASMILIAREIVPGFYVHNFWYALLLSLFLSLVSGIFNGRIVVKKNIHRDDELM
ncbi:MAG: phage holin family protein [Flavobacteriales bacterium]|nr:phage holin family protein [Flavobacteriales bacterium]